MHVPPRGANVSEIRRISADHGLTICSYGSYYRVGQPLDELKACLDTAADLGTQIVRIWAGQKGSKEMSSDERQATVAMMIEGAQIAREQGLTLALEYHGGTLTDERDSACRLVEETACVADALKFYWQPRFTLSAEERLASLNEVRSRLSHLHVFSWTAEPWPNNRLPLADEESMWKKVLSSMKEDRYALLEFVKDDSDESLLRDAATLRGWCE